MSIKKTGYNKKDSKTNQVSNAEHLSLKILVIAALAGHSFLCPMVFDYIKKQSVCEFRL